MAYTSRKRRMAANPEPEPVETMEEGMPIAGDEAAAEPASEDEKLSAFAPMEFFGREVKPGDTEEIRIVAVDPETREVQFECTYKKGQQGTGKSVMDEFDEAMPA